MFLFIASIAKSQSDEFLTVTLKSDIEAFKKSLLFETSKVLDIKADFVQTKWVDFLDESVVSTGILYFSTGKRLRWEYVKPYSLIFILNASKAWMMNHGLVTEMDVNSNKMLRELSELMLFGIDCSSLFANANFEFAFRRSELQWEVNLKPRSKDIKALFLRIDILFSALTYQMEAVRMIEVSGDETFIQLTNPIINNFLPDSLFDGEK